MILKDDTGILLKKKREELGLSVHEVAERTKIRESFIDSLEKGDKRSLPDSYQDLFLKKYAAFLGVKLPEPDIPEQKSDVILEMLSEEGNGDAGKDAFRKKLRKYLLFLYVNRAVLLIMILAVFLFIFTRHIYILLNSGEKTYKSESGVKIITIEGDPGDRISVNVKDSIMLDDDGPDMFSFRITASDSCYICYFTDTLKVKETMLMPGQNFDMTAEKVIEAKLGKSGAVSLFLEEKNVLPELLDQKNASSFIRVTNYSAVKIKKSDKIAEYLKYTYGIE